MTYEIQVDRANSWTDVAEKIGNGIKCDFIFIDPMMAGADGVEVIEAIRNMGYRNSIVALTEETVNTTHSLFPTDGFVGIIAKSIGIHQTTAYFVRFIRAKHCPCNVFE